MRVTLCLSFCLWLLWSQVNVDLSQGVQALLCLELALRLLQGSCYSLGRGETGGFLPSFLSWSCPACKIPSSHPGLAHPLVKSLQLDVGPRPFLPTWQPCTLMLTAFLVTVSPPEAAMASTPVRAPVCWMLPKPHLLPAPKYLCSKIKPSISRDCRDLS